MRLQSRRDRPMRIPYASRSGLFVLPNIPAYPPGPVHSTGAPRARPELGLADDPFGGYYNQLHMAKSHTQRVGDDCFDGAHNRHLGAAVQP